MTTRTIPALALLDAEVARLSRPRTWAGARVGWADEPCLAPFAHAGALLAHLRGSGEETDPVAAVLVRRAAAGDDAALTMLLATLVGVFVVAARRTVADGDDAVADLLSLAAEVVAAGGLPDRHVLSVLVSRVQSRHRRLRRRTRAVCSGSDALRALASGDDPARRAVARVELAELGGSLRHHLRVGSFTTDDWRRLVDLRVHHRTSAELARAEAMSASAVRKRAQRTAEALEASRARLGSAA